MAHSIPALFLVYVQALQIAQLLEDRSCGHGSEMLENKKGVGTLILKISKSNLIFFYQTYSFHMCIFVITLYSITLIR